MAFRVKIKAMKARCMRDLAVGETFKTGSELLTRDELVKFSQKFDPQPMHMDEEAEKNTVFRRLVASGWNVASMTIRLMIDAHPFGSTPLVGLVVRELRFHRAVEPETTLTCRAVINALELGEKPTHGHVTMTVETLDAKTGEVLLTQIWRVLVPAEPRV